MKVKQIRKVGRRRVVLRDLTTRTENFVANNIVIHNSHITALVLMMFDKFCRQLIEEGRVGILQVPLWGLVNSKKKLFKPLKERPQYVDNGYQLVRFKGLGEFEPWQFQAFLRDDKFLYVPKPVKVDYEKLLRNKKLLISDIERYFRGEEDEGLR